MLSDRMPSPKSYYYRRPGRFAMRKENFRAFSNDYCYYPAGVLLWAQTNKSLFGEPLHALAS